MKLKLESTKEEIPGVFSFWFIPEEKVSWKAGQFFHYILHHEPTDERGSDRWFTIASAPYEEKIMLTTRFDGEKMSTFKKALKELKVGDEIEATDLEGDFTVEDAQKQMVFIAGGIGVTPFRSIIKELDHEGKPINVTLLYANRSEDNIAYKDEFESIAKTHPEFKIHYVISPERIDVAKIKELVPDYKERIVYVSGPEPMVEELGNALKESGLKEDHLKQDWFPGYPKE